MRQLRDTRPIVRQAGLQPPPRWARLRSEGASSWHGVPSAPGPERPLRRWVRKRVAAKGRDVNEDARPKQESEVPEELLDEVSGGVRVADRVTPPDPFVKTQR